MIRIVVDKQDLTLYRDTSFVMELNNPVFSTEAIEGDVVYNFDIPVAGNERVFGFAHLPYTQEQRTYDCLVFVDGVQLIHGNLIVQKSTRLSYSVAIVVNPFPEGWADRSVRDNEDEEIVIARRFKTRREEWVDFLQASIADDSNVKFGMFQDEEGYGDANETFQNHPAYEPMQKMVNRLFVFNNQVVNNSADNPSNLFGVIFNKYRVHWIEIAGESYRRIDERIPMNVFCFCPQLRLVSIFEKFIHNGGYSTMGAFFNDTNIHSIFLQSTKALDGVSSEFSEMSNMGHLSAYVYDSYITDDFVRVHSNWHQYEPGGLYDNTGVTVFDSNYDRTLFDEIQATANLINVNFYHQFMLDRTGHYRFTIRLRINPCDMIVQLRIMIFVGNRMDFDGDPRGEVVYLSELFNMPIDGSYVERAFILHLDNVRTFSLKICRERPNMQFVVDGVNVSRTQYITVHHLSDIEIQQLDSEDEKELNIFARSFVPMRFLPDISNSDFLKLVCNSLGLTCFFDYRTRKTEFGFVKDLQKSNYLVVDDLILDREMSKDVEDGEGVHFKYDSLSKDEDSSITDWDGTVDNRNLLPDPNDNAGRIWLVSGENAFYEVAFNDRSDGSVEAVWERKCSADHPLVVGGGKTEITPVAYVPDLVAYDTHKDVLIPDIPVKIESDMFGTEASDKLILLLYRGKQTFTDRQGRMTYQIENMMPFFSGALSLTASGANSIGEEYLKPWLDILSSECFITHKFLLPIGKVLEVMRLLRPQDMPPEEQTRFIMVNNVRILPKKISIQIDNSSDLYLCEIQGIRA